MKFFLFPRDLALVDRSDFCGCLIRNLLTPVSTNYEYGKL